MPLPLLELPPELLLQILSPLPTKSLLQFAQTSHYALSLAYSNLHTLSLALAPTYQSIWHAKLFAATQFPEPPSHPDYDPHAVQIQIPQAWDFDYPTLLTFHNKIISSILNRHACALQKLDLTLWTLSIPIAQALAKLPALRDLSITTASAQAIPRAYTSPQRREESRAWNLLAMTANWTRRVQILRIENAEIATAQLCDLLSKTETLQQLTLHQCDMLTSTLWPAPALEQLHNLRITDCINIHIQQPALDAISKMQGLQVRLHPPSPSPLPYP